MKTKSGWDIFILEIGNNDSNLVVLEWFWHYGKLINYFNIPVNSVFASIVILGTVVLQIACTYVVLHGKWQGITSSYIILTVKFLHTKHFN